MKPTVYLETTVVSYLTCWPSRDVVRLSHEILTRHWWDQSRAHFSTFVSPLVIEEASAGDASAAAERLKALEQIPILEITESAIVLGEQLAAVLRLPDRARADAFHISVAAVHGMEYLLTWNCRHLANATFVDRIELACRDAGFLPPRIVTPELLSPPE